MEYTIVPESVTNRAAEFLVNILLDGDQPVSDRTMAAAAILLSDRLEKVHEQVREIHDAIDAGVEEIDGALIGLQNVLSK